MLANIGLTKTILNVSGFKIPPLQFKFENPIYKYDFIITNFYRLFMINMDFKQFYKYEQQFI